MADRILDCSRFCVKDLLFLANRQEGDNTDSGSLV